MRVMTKLSGIAMAVAAFTAAGHGQTVSINAIGSSAQFLEAGLAAGSATSGTPAGLGATCVWSKKSSNTGALEATDPTVNQTETGNAWIAWSPGSGGTCASPSSSSVIYAYLQTDSTVGVRCYFNKCTIGPTATSPVGTAPDGLIFGTSGEVALSSTVWNKLTGQVENVAATDIRPEDAAFATLRATTACGSTLTGTGDGSGDYEGLGYTSGGTPIASEYSSSTFHVTSFPFSSTSSFAVTPVGAAPIVVFVNPKNTSGFGSSGFTNIKRADLAKFLDGSYGKTNDGTTGITGSAPTTTLVREPLSGTYNTIEYAVPNTNLENFTSQDVGLNQLSTQKNCNGNVPKQNPLNFTTNDDTSATRNRVIGTGQMVSVEQNLTAPLTGAQNPDTLAYAFWSVGNFAASTSANGKYLQVDGVDPIETSYVTGGVLPTAAGNNLNDVTFANINNGTYPIWSTLRLVSATPAPAAVTKLATVEQKFVNGTTRPDFIAYTSLKYVHSHFTPPGVTYPANSTPNNGGSCGTEAGGDVGGVIYSNTTCTIHQRQ